jgi:hypothetical protein
MLASRLPTTFFIATLYEIMTASDTAGFLTWLFVTLKYSVTTIRINPLNTLILVK